MNEEMIAKKNAAEEFLSSKERTVYTMVSALWELNYEVQLEYLNHLEEEQMAGLRALREKYGQDEFVKHLSEIFTDEDELHDLSGGQGIVGIDLETKHYQYEFNIHEVNEDGTVHSSRTLVTLTDEQYVELLTWRLNDQKFTINALKYANRELYELITRGIDGYFDDGDLMYMTWKDAPYTATMDEVNRDAEAILEKHPEWRTDTFYRSYLY